MHRIHVHAFIHPAMPLLEPVSTLRDYDGQAHVHIHDHAQVMMPLAGRMELEIDGHALFTDPSCGMLIPAGARHAYCAQPGTRILVIDAPESRGLEKLRRFALTPACRALGSQGDAARQLALLLDLPTVLASRRGLDLARLDAALAQALHESWPTARMARLFNLSPQRFHARLLELTGRTPGDHLRALRLERASQALARGATLEVVAAQVGYRSGSALAYALRRDRGTGVRSLRQTAS
ncbi:AraC family transcriptional regulator [Castellaniella daejeonensis]|jgi:AraC-like DNA-binding protein|uniref:AraC family transcriptional regulator n=1 Tax=Castellaniella daejeonensis TaxID=659013 RepID=A0ABP3D532_9BURK|nr:helix-turn-helix domain-containing protein [Castellaniella sp.]HET8704611.1 helix-turn-helix domain-containing protein [Castellaniella sp.]